MSRYSSGIDFLCLWQSFDRSTLAHTSSLPLALSRALRTVLPGELLRTLSELRLERKVARALYRAIRHRDRARLYAKPINAGRSEFDLSPEESQALETAMRPGT